LLFPVGRLDKDTEGFLLVTDDGNLCFELMKPENEIPKTYFFWALGTLKEEKIKEIESGVSIYKGRDFETAPAKVVIAKIAKLSDIKDFLCEQDAKMSRNRGEMPVTAGYITITEGKKHQVKRMIRYTGCRVLYLKRVAIGALRLDEDLPVGDYRALSSSELDLIKYKKTDNV
jgi:16S rRNA pseudouridine516 synthase